jgi:hypothetical protein
MRLYEKAKYAVIKYETVEFNDKKSKESKSKAKEANDKIMNHVWKIMKYTQGENETKVFMKFYMPVFVHIDERPNANDKAGEKTIEVKIMVSLPPEYQTDEIPPKPNESDIIFEELDAFKCFVR